MRYLRGILNDETYQKYDTYSDISKIPTATVSMDDIPNRLRTLDVLLPPPEITHHPHLHTYDIPEEEYTRYEQMAIGHFVICTEEEAHPTPYTTPDTSHLLWESPMFPTSDLEERSISPTTILTILASDNKNMFTHPLTETQLSVSQFRLQADGGANMSVTTNMDYLATS